MIPANSPDGVQTISLARFCTTNSEHKRRLKVENQLKKLSLNCRLAKELWQVGPSLVGSLQRLQMLGAEKADELSTVASDPTSLPLTKGNFVRQVWWKGSITWIC